MPSDIGVSITLPYVTNLPRDVAVNTFAVVAADATPGSLTDIYSAFDEFYQDIGSIFGRLVSRTAEPIFKAYDLEAPEPRVPLLESEMTLLPAPGEAAQLPPETAVCLSFKGTYASGASNARRRGRVFLGPLEAGMLSNVTSTPVVTQSKVDSILTAAFVLSLNLTNDGHYLGIYSRADSFVYRAVEAWIDDATDTQRRRGLDPGQRTTQVLSTA